MPATAVHSFDMIDKTIGTVGAGAIGAHIQKRLAVRAVPYTTFNTKSSSTMRVSFITLG